MDLKREVQEHQENTNKVADNNNHAFRGISSPGSSKEFKVPMDLQDTANEETMQSKKQFQFGLPDIDSQRNSKVNTQEQQRPYRSNKSLHFGIGQGHNQ